MLSSYKFNDSTFDSRHKLSLHSLSQSFSISLSVSITLSISCKKLHATKETVVSFSHSIFFVP